MPDFRGIQRRAIHPGSHDISGKTPDVIRGRYVQPFSVKRERLYAHASLDSLMIPVVTALEPKSNYAAIEVNALEQPQMCISEIGAATSFALATYLVVAAMYTGLKK